MEKFVCQGVHIARDTWQDGEGRECRFVSIGKEMKQNAENFKRDFVLYAAEEILRFKVVDQVQTRVGDWQEMDCGRKSKRKSRREKSVVDDKRKGQEEVYSRSQVKESGEKLQWRREGASSIATRVRRESCEEAAVPKIIQVIDSHYDKNLRSIVRNVGDEDETDLWDVITTMEQMTWSTSLTALVKSRESIEEEDCWVSTGAIPDQVMHATGTNESEGAKDH